MSKEIIPIERIAQSIYRFRGQKVMLDFDLATFPAIRDWLDRMAAHPGHVRMEQQAADVAAE